MDRIRSGEERRRFCLWNKNWGKKEEDFVYGIIIGEKRRSVCLWNKNWGKKKNILFMK